MPRPGPRLRPRLRTLAAVAAVVATTTVATVTAAAVASTHTFSDVPVDHPFRAEISALAATGIAAGYPDGRYQPLAPVSRQAMAAFLARGLGRAGQAGGSASGPGTADRTVATVAIQHRASGYLVVQAATTATVTADELCPCLVETRLVAGSRQSPTTRDELGGEAHAGGSVVGSTANTWVVPVFGAGSSSVSLVARRANAATGNPTTLFEGSLTAHYVPFDATGTFAG
jgi:hypothetical protein